MEVIGDLVVVAGLPEAFGEKRIDGVG